MEIQDLIFKAVTYFGNFLIVVFVGLLYQRVRFLKLNCKKVLCMAAATFAAYIILFELPLGMFPELRQFLDTNRLIFLVYNNLSNYFVLLCFSYVFIDRNLKVNMMLTAVCWTGFQIVYYLLNNLAYVFVDVVGFPYLLVGVLIICMEYWLLDRFISKSRLSLLLTAFQEKNYSFQVIFLFALFIVNLQVILNGIVLRREAGWMTEEFVLLAIVIISFALLAKQALHLFQEQETKKYQQMVLSQQNLYIQNLEETQQNLRTLKHDYKNMMASLYLQSKKHDFEKLEENIQKMMDDFDVNIDRKMNINHQLSNLKHLELKSLLFQKITEIHRQNIPFHLEIFQPVREIPVEAIDLVRIVGILMDNAIEAVKESQGDIILLLMQQENSLTLVVDNYVDEDVDIDLIVQQGYTTKQNHTGLGLAGLEQIVRKYPNMLHNYSCMNHRFVQEIMIANH